MTGRYDKFLLVIFLVTLPMVNPWIRGDGVGYYAYARAMLIEHRLDFTKDWLAANTSFRMSHTDMEGHLVPSVFTATGHLANHFSVGPAILWAPFLIVTHVGVNVYDKLGGHVTVDGYSYPYIVTVAVASALYGFLALWLSFRLARKYVAECWAFLATMGIWFASSLPIYMYFNPSWAHAGSAFTVALFLWYWDRTRVARTWQQWLILGAVGGLMMDVYYISAVVLVVPLLESLETYWSARKAKDPGPVMQLVVGNALFAVALLTTFFPTLVTRKIIFGSYFQTGYSERWFWESPAILRVSFSADHGLFSWTPIVLLAVAGLFFLRKCDRTLAVYTIALFGTYLYAVGCYQNWDGLSSFGNRFFVSLSTLFVLGLAAFFDFLERTWQERRTAIIASTATFVLILWNLGLMFQWGMHLIPARGPISWRQAAYNQFRVVPIECTAELKRYLDHRQALMDEIENRDVQQLKKQQSDPSRDHK
jgi:hypothetical protein